MGIIGGVSEFFGLDIGLNAVRIVQLEGTGKVRSLAKHGQSTITPAVSLAENAEDARQLIEHVLQTLKEAKVHTKNVVLGLPSSQVFSRIVATEKLRSRDINKSIRLQIASYIPTPIEKSKIDWVNLGQHGEDKTKLDVLINSIGNDYIERRLDILESAGLSAIAFEPRIVAMSRSLLDDSITQAQVIIDIGDYETDVTGVFRQAPYLNRSLSTNLTGIIQAVKDQVDDNQVKAEQYVFRIGLDETKANGRVAKAIRPTIDRLVEDVVVAVRYFAGEEEVSGVDRIILTGSGCQVAGLGKYIANKTKVKVEIGNAWRNVNYKAEYQQELLSKSHDFAVAVGLAERRE